ncbi:ATP-dependent DNA helicase RecG [Lentilactobacillus sp. Marseille-Q4993]|uniref:ATP-dependent DNA helicase RecG n=1 Tax=Lentilactobacillus sp. Marseille-Q4993 TaxID=3039492 RepID=UPI0024BC15F9|nr:ATP-dependent DNA helicase RecG [Lentilactobacillus sp. Marseille-Q4993]
MELTDSVTVLKGVGDKTAVALNKLGINSINDLLTYYPRRYDDFSIKKPDESMDGAKITVKGQIVSEPSLSFFGRKRSRLRFLIKIDDETYPVSFFNQPWLKKQLEIGDEKIVFGTFDASKQQINGIKIISKQSGSDYDSIYPTTKEVKQATIKKLIKEAYEQCGDKLVDFIPQTIRDHYRLESFRQTVANIHFPTSPHDAELAYRTAKFDEFFLFSMRIQMMKLQKRNSNAASIVTYQPKVIDEFKSTLAFELTTAQNKVVDEILADLESDRRMNRLLQGDVGSGKTVVAALAMAAVVSAGKQAAIMAPTEILAEQHANNLASMFAKLGFNIALLTGATSAAARKQLLPRIANGEVDIIVGTHALFQDAVEYKDLALAIIDEQHRFGVHQRQALKEKGEATNVLAMTATPIPRTLAITMYGDMDVSIIDQMPNGRKPVKTTWVPSTKTNSALGFMKKQLDAGKQAYVVAPLIEESDAVDMRNATEIFEKFKKLFSPQYQVGLLHGQMTNDEKDQAMQDFKQGKFAVLVATTVIEVGVDVKNANVMIIFDADHFGLSQLHQLRGRVGRSSEQAYCVLIADPKNEIGKERMRAISSSTDGFFLSQKDLELRGQGDITGLKQSGMPDFKVGDPVADINILNVAVAEAKNITSKNNWQKSPENVQLFKYLKSNQTINTD